MPLPPRSERQRKQRQPEAEANGASLPRWRETPKEAESIVSASVEVMDSSAIHESTLSRLYGEARDMTAPLAWRVPRLREERATRGRRGINRERPKGAKRPEGEGRKRRAFLAVGRCFLKN
jgi:hypothetical protein